MKRILRCQDAEKARHKDKIANNKRIIIIDVVS